MPETRPDADPVIEHYKKVDRALLRDHLKLTPQQRLKRAEIFHRLGDW